MSSKMSKGGGRKAPSVWERRAQVEKDIAMKLARELESVKAELRLQSGCCDGAAAQDAHVRREREEHKAEVERLREVIRTIRARCVELDDSDAVSETLDIATAVLEDKP